MNNSKIYLVTGQQMLFPSVIFEVISVAQSIEMLQTLTVIGLDTETTGFDPYTKDLVSVQMGNKDFQVFIDTTSIDVGVYKDLLESKDKLFILHNAKFDLKFFYHKRITVNNVYDTFLGEKLLWLGYPPGYRGMSLLNIAKEYLGVSLDKSVRGKTGLTDEVIRYGCEDVRYLEQLMTKQKELQEKKSLLKAIDVENGFVKVLAYIEYCGIKVSEERWKIKMEADQQKLNDSRKAIEDWIVEKSETDSFFKRYFHKDLQGDLFLGFNNDYVWSINWNSSRQLIPLFEHLGLDLSTKDKKTGKIKKSVDAKILDMQRDKTELVNLYLQYSKDFKIVSTYGEGVLKQINPKTRRIHTNFTQLMNTGRISSGGKDRENKIDYINLQNLPGDAVTRACFIAEQGNMLVDCDYTAQEDLVFAELSQEPKLIDFYNDTIRKRDGHSYVAKICFPAELDNIAEERVKGERPDLRALAKKAKFAIHYGGNGTTISRNLGLPIEQGMSIEKAYLSGFTEINSYFQKAKKNMWDRGYILISELTGHKMFIPEWNSLKGFESRFNKDFWNKYREEKAKDPESALVERVKHFFKRKSGYERNALNAPVQGTSAVITKLAGIKFFNILIKEGLLFKVLIVNAVHDEYLIESPLEYTNDVAEWLQECMEGVGKIFVKSVTLKAEPEISTHWVH